MNSSRRSFLYSLLSLSLAPPEVLSRALPRQSKDDELSFTPAQKELLACFCEQIYPKDDYAGAREVGVPDFIERALREAHPDWLAIYRMGLNATDAASRSRYGLGFCQVSFEQQMTLLVQMEKGTLPQEGWGRLDAREFFQMVRDHTMQGAYSHPKYGGNRDKAAWDMIGYYDFWTE
ncbi:MAG: gluconate 2-dehydrogenase subunit 3 family protein [Acidobacteriota bacterium]